MLFAYTYVPHTMDKMQAFIEYIFLQVWCQAPGGKPYSFDLYDTNPELKAMVETFHYSDAKGAYFFNSHIERIYHLFAGFSPEQIDQLKAWFTGNNNIAALCRNDPNVAVARYCDLEAFDKPLAQAMASFFKGLYNKELLERGALKAVIGEIDGHHFEFTKVNNQGKCPFCGIQDVKGIYHSKREAYDHYLPKAKYPFNSINFRNLAPACHECNSSYKQIKDPLHVPKDPLKNQNGERRKSFYPFQVDAYQIELKIKIVTQDWNDIQPDELSLDLGPEKLRDEIETWLDVYGIEERYKAKCCGNNDGKGWILSVLDEWKEDGRDPKDYLKTLARQAKVRPFTDDNFLKQPFLEACQMAGLFDAL